MKAKIVVCINVLIAVAFQGCLETGTDYQQKNHRLNITILDILTADEFREAGGFGDDISSGSTYVQLSVENMDKDTLYIFGAKPKGKDLTYTYLPATIEYSYFDSLEMNREYHGGAGFNMGLSLIALPPGSSNLFYFYDMTDYRTDSVTYMFDYKRDTIMDPDRECHISITYLLKNKEAIANVAYEDTCAPEATPVRRNQ